MAKGKRPIKRNPISHDTPEYHHFKALEKLDRASARILFDDHKIHLLIRERGGNIINSWEANRGYRIYNRSFKAILGKSIVDALRVIPRKEGTPLTIIHDGIGEKARFSTELKSKLNKLKISSRIIGFSLEPSPEAKAKVGTVLWRLVEGPAEKHLPKKPVDAIISEFGSIDYAYPKVQKNHLLKLAYSLKKGGILMAGLGGGTIVDKRFMTGVVKAFQKRGFEARFGKPKLFSPLVNFSGTYPTFVLFVRRK